MLVSEKKECGGSETSVGWKSSLAECAHSCRGTSSMFIYGTNDFGVSRCNSGGKCRCYCETSSSSGECNQINHKGYRLYKYESVNTGNCHESKKVNEAFENFVF